MTNEEETMIGRKFNNLIVVGKTSNRSTNRQMMWLCECICGDQVEVRTDSLKSGDKFSCGCTRRSNNDLEGKTFGKLTVIEEVAKEERLGDKKHRTWLCRCECGNLTKGKSNELKRGKANSCGCDNHENLAGKSFGKIKVIEELPKEEWLYVNKQVTWLCKCDCGNTLVTTTSSLKSGRTQACGCVNRYREDMVGRKYGIITVTEELPREDTPNSKVTWKYLCQCGNPGTATTGNLKSGRMKSCGCSRESLGEIAIRGYLEEQGVPYESEYTFKDLYYTSESYLLRFDFAIFSESGELRGLIEYDGEQHFRPIEFFGGMKGFIETVARDRLKNNYCKENNIPLLRIPYTAHNNIGTILALVVV